MNGENGQNGPLPGGLAAWMTALAAALLAAYAVTVASPPAFDAKYSLYLDSASFYWMRELWDRTLFGTDRLAAIYRDHLFSVSPEGLWVWPTAVLIKLFGYAAGLKVLAVAACAAAALLVRRLALASPARAVSGAAAALFIVLFLSMDTFFGVPRVYGALTLLAFSAAAEERRFLLLPFLAALCFAVYPVLAAGLAASSLAAPFFFREEFSVKRLRRRYAAALAAAAAAILIFMKFSLVLAHASADQANRTVFESDKLYQRVASALDPRDPADALFNFALNFNEHSRLFAIIAALFVLVYLLGVLVEPRRPAALPRSLPPLLAGCAAAFAALYPLHPVTASRQLVFVVPLTLVFLAAEGLFTVFGEKLKAAPVVLAAGALFICLHPVFNETYSMRAYAEVYDFLSSRPRGSTVAGYPESDLVFTTPVFSDQAAALTTGTADQELLFLTSVGEYAARRRDLLRALYCADPGAAGRLAGGAGVKWLLFEKKYYSEDFLSGAASSPWPSDREAAEVSAASGKEPAACYAAYSAHAAFRWKNQGSEGFAVPLGAEAK